MLEVHVGDEPRHLANRARATAPLPAPSSADVHSACLATPARAKGCEHALVVELTVLPGLEAQVLPGAQNLTCALCHARQPDPAAARGAVGDHELDLGVRPLGRTRDAAGSRR